MNEPKRRSIITLLFLMIVVIVVCLIIYSFVNSNKVEKELETAKNTISSNLTKINELTEQIKESDKLTAELSKKQVGKFVSFDSSKCLNKEDGIKYVLGSIKSQYAVMNLENGKVYVELTEDFSNEFLKEGNPINLEMNTKYEVKGFTQNVVDVNVYSVGHLVNQTVMLFLMEDGSVEILPLQKIRLDGLKTFGKIKGVEKVVRIVDGVASGDLAGYVSPFAIAESGGFYSLATLIQSQGFFD